MVALAVAAQRRQNWQQWRLGSIKILDFHISNNCTCLLLKEPPLPKFTVSQHVAEATLKKAMSLCLFLRLMYERDDSTSTHVPAQTFAKDLAEKAGKLVGVSASFVYRAYKEWREGQEELAIRAKEKGEKLDSNKDFFIG